MKKILTHYNGVRFAHVKTINNLSVLLKISVPKLLASSQTSSIRYRAGKIPKPDGDTRDTKEPLPELKKAQRMILKKIFGEITLNECVYGIGKSCSQNARAHMNNPFLSHYDITKFFPSIHHSNVERMFYELGFPPPVAQLLTRITTDEHCLPQGAPTSPYISSILLNNLDTRIISLTRKNKLKYTRYFDDLNISGRVDTETFEKQINHIVQTEGYRLNKKKTEHFKPSDEKKITGITIRANKLCAPETEEQLLSHIVNMQNGTTNCESALKLHEHFKGSLAFLKDVNRNTYKKIKVAYALAIKALESKSSSSLLT